MPPPQDQVPVQKPIPTQVDPALAVKQAEAIRQMEQSQWSNHIAMTKAVLAAENARPKEDPAKVDKRVVEFLQYRVDHGSADARYDLAQRYLAGKGVEKDDAKARQLLKEAADQGHADSVKLLKKLNNPVPDPTEAVNASPAPVNHPTETVKAQQ
jgi:TPR repeat protein